MSYGRDFDAPEAARLQPASTDFRHAEFVGPLAAVDQAWAEHTLRTDNSAALFEPADNVIRRREAHIGSLYRMAALLTLSGDLAGGSAVGFRAIAESRALSEFLAANPSYCLDCFLLGDRCQRHREVEPPAAQGGAGPSAPGSAQPTGGVSQRAPGRSMGGSGAGSGGARPAPGPQPDWRRFGAEGFPSADG